MQFAAVVHIFGIILCTLGVTMPIPGIVELAVGDPHADAFFFSCAITLFAGVGLILSTRPRVRPVFGIRQMFALTTLAWVGVSLFAALPFLLHGINMDVTDAFFEAISGLTTTGSTVMTGLDKAPDGILVWRSMLQWLGGVGIIVMAIVALPILRVGGMQLYRTESSDKQEKVLPTATRSIQAIAGVYLSLTITCILAFWAAGMSLFDAIMHGMTTLSTGGYSTHDASFGFFTQPHIHWIAVLYMIAGAIPFALYIKMMTGDGRAFARASQVRLLLLIILAASVALTLWLVVRFDYEITLALRLAAFNVVSILTTTGFANADYMTWGGFAVFTIFLLTYLGGCTGSTSGGIKMLRLQIVYLFARAQVMRQLMPHRVVPMKFEGQDISPDIGGSVLAFIGLYVASVVVIGLMLSALGLDFVTALSGAAQAIGNIGPGLGPTIGPAGNFASLPDAAKWLLGLAMLLGRLELMTVLVLFTAAYWRG